jgi:hypothetical protein
VEEEADFDVFFGLADGFAEETGEDHEMVILDPD